MGHFSAGLAKYGYGRNMGMGLRCPSMRLRALNLLNGHFTTSAQAAVVSKRDAQIPRSQMTRPNVAKVENAADPSVKGEL